MRCSSARALRQGRRRALRHDQRVHQDDPRERPRRGGVLPGADDRERRGPAVHRAPARDLRERRRRFGRPRTRCRWRSRRSKASISSGCRRDLSRWRTRRSTSRPRRRADSRRPSVRRGARRRRATRNDPVPIHLRNAPTQFMKHLGYGSGGGPISPEAIAGRVYFEPGGARRHVRSRGPVSRMNIYLRQRGDDDRPARGDRSDGAVAGRRVQSDLAARAGPRRPGSARRRADPGSGRARGRPREIIFTGSGSEAMCGRHRRGAGGGSARAARAITRCREHRAVLHAFDVLEGAGWEVTRLPVDAAGLIDPASFTAALRPQTTLASVMLANNESVGLQPIADLAARARRAGARVTPTRWPAPAA